MIFEIALADAAALDKAEGLGRGYAKEHVEVVVVAAIVKAKTYIATKKESVLRPYHWYKAVTVAGAVEHGFRDRHISAGPRVQVADRPRDPGCFSGQLSQ